jgi:hypothetical protein
VGEVRPPGSTLAGDERPFAYAGYRMPQGLSAGEIDSWFDGHLRDLAFGLIRHHGLDIDRIALLYQFRALKPPPPEPVGVRVSFAAEETEGREGLNLHEAALVANFARGV